MLHTQSPQVAWVPHAWALTAAPLPVTEQRVSRHDRPLCVHVRISVLYLAQGFSSAAAAAAPVKAALVRAAHPKPPSCLGAACMGPDCRTAACDRAVSEPA